MIIYIHTQKYTYLNKRDLNKHSSRRIKLVMSGFLGGVVVENPPANAGDMGSSSGLGRSHMPWRNWACAPQLLSLRSTAREPQLRMPACLEPMLRNKRSHCNEKPTHHKKSSPRSPQLEKARTQQGRPNAAKNKLNKLILKNLIKNLLKSLLDGILGF